MRILHVLTNRPKGQAEDYASAVIGELHRADIRQYIVADRPSSWSDRLGQSGIEVIFHAAPFLQRWRLGRMIGRLQPDIVHCWTSRAIRLAPGNKIPVVGWLAGYDDLKNLPRCTHIISADRGSAIRLAKNANYRTPAGFIPVFSEYSSAPPLDRRLLATPGDARVLVSLAPVHPSGRFDLLLTALKNLPDCILWLAGEGSFRTALESMARHHGVIDRIRFVAERMNRDALLRAGDICVVTAADRPFDMIVSRAWAAGTPVVASRRNGLASPLENDVTGLVVPPGDGAALTQAIRRILDEEILRRRLVAKGYASYLGTYAREAVVRRWMELYRQIAACR